MLAIRSNFGRELRIFDEFSVNFKFLVKLQSKCKRKIFLKLFFENIIIIRK